MSTATPRLISTASTCVQSHHNRAKGRPRPPHLRPASTVARQSPSLSTCIRGERATAGAGRTPPAARRPLFEVLRPRRMDEFDQFVPLCRSRHECPRRPLAAAPAGSCPRHFHLHPHPRPTRHDHQARPRPLHGACWSGQSVAGITRVFRVRASSMGPGVVDETSTLCMPQPAGADCCPPTHNFRS